MHKLTDSKMYMVNGLLMTIVFFMCRCVLQTWILTCRLLPAVVYRGAESLAEVDYTIVATYYFSCMLNVALMCLNFMWFNKMFKGLLKFFYKSSAKAKEE